MNENRFNLIDEPWIPVIDMGLVSLKEVFSNQDIKGLGGNPVQKIAITKLLLAVAQSANTPKNNQVWSELGSDGLARSCLSYLDKWHDRFYLYGDQPFLQVPTISIAGIQPLGALIPEVGTGKKINKTVLSQIEIDKPLSDADKALLVLQLISFGLGGKKADNTAVLTSGYAGKTNPNGKGAAGKPSASIGFMGFLHSFLQGSTLQESIWLNTFSNAEIEKIKTYSGGLGIAPWENMPLGEDDEVAKQLTKSLLGRLVPMSRFLLLNEAGMHYSEGIAHLGYKEGMVDPSISVNFMGKIPKAIWVDPEKRPWRMLTALLSFISAINADRFDCYQTQFGFDKGISQVDKIGVWSGGLRVSSNAGEQYISGSDDFVESIIQVPTGVFGESWFTLLKGEMSDMDAIAKTLYGCVMSYYKHLTSEGKNQAAQATNLFWQLCERRFQELIYDLEDPVKRHSYRKVFASFIHKAYSTYCPNNTARQLDAWAQAQPNLSKYLKKDK